jgi:hypothetical protein
MRVQVVTPTADTWNHGKHRAICYDRFAADMTASAG